MDGEPTSEPQRRWRGREPEVAFRHSIFVPFDRSVDRYAVAGRVAVPWEYTSWRDEVQSWKQSCYLHGHLNPVPTYRISGPDALRFFSDTHVNTIQNFDVGRGKHGIMCNEAGLVISDGVALRTAEDEIVTYWEAPYIEYALASGNYDAVGEDLTGQVFMFQLAGPRSLEVVERAAQSDLHDLAFMRSGLVTIADAEVRVLRMGMGGSLAYEVHGPIDAARDVYQALHDAGRPLGLRQLGAQAYMLNHTENGYPQAYYHFPYPWFEDPGFAAFLRQRYGLPDEAVVTHRSNRPVLGGSMGDDLRLRYRNPVELGWAKMIAFDHDFVGRAALETEVADPRRQMVTLVWDTDDVLDIHASQYRPGEPYAPMDEPNHYVLEAGGNGLHADEVRHGGTVVGISSGRAYSATYRQMLSLASIATPLAHIGTEVTVVWGAPGMRQKEIRATVARFPYLDTGRNQDVDVSAIPRAGT